mgnify:CR=1 FL=1
MHATETVTGGTCKVNDGSGATQETITLSGTTGSSTSYYAAGSYTLVVAAVDGAANAYTGTQAITLSNADLTQTVTVS